MTTLKAQDALRRFKAAADMPPLILIHGADRGLVRELAAGLIAAATAGSDDPFGVIKLDGADVAADPGRLSDEARTIALFGGRRTVWVRDGASRNLLPAIEPLLEAPPADAVVIIEMGELRKGLALRKRVEDSRTAVAIACYADAARDLDRLIDEETAALGLTIAADARSVLHGLIGGDRAASRSEVQKLCLFAYGDGQIDVPHVAAIVGDVSANAVTDAVDAAFLGRTRELDSSLARLSAAAVHGSVIGGAALRWAQTLRRARLEVEAGTPAGRAVERISPAVFFARKPAVTAMLEAWPADRLARAARAIDAAIYGSRRQPALAGAIVGRALLQVAAVAAAAAAERGGAPRAQ